MTKTEHLGLWQDAETDHYSVARVNDNSAILDIYCYQNRTRIQNAEGAIAAETEQRTNADTAIENQLAAKPEISDIFGVGTAIAGDADLDDVRAPGRYYYGSVAAQTIAHVPRTDCGGELTVENVQNANRVRQTFVPNNTTADAALFYVRMFTSSYGGAWTPWYRFSGEAVS